MLIFLLSLLVNICLKEKWLTESWGPYQLDQFGLGKVYIFPQKCVFAEEMCFWIPVVSLNKNNKRIEAKIKSRWSSLIKILNWEYEVHITKCKVVSLIKHSKSWKQIFIRQSFPNFGIVWEWIWGFSPSYWFLWLIKVISCNHRIPSLEWDFVNCNF